MPLLIILLVLVYELGHCAGRRCANPQPCARVVTEETL